MQPKNPRRANFESFDAEPRDAIDEPPAGAVEPFSLPKKAHQLRQHLVERSSGSDQRNAARFTLRYWTSRTAPEAIDELLSTHR